MFRFALVNEQTMICENISLDERPANEIVVAGYLIIDITDTSFGIGDIWNGTTFEKGYIPAPLAQAAEIQPESTGTQTL